MFDEIFFFKHITSFIGIDIKINYCYFILSFSFRKYKYYKIRNKVKIT